MLALSLPFCQPVSGDHDVVNHEEQEHRQLAAPEVKRCWFNFVTGVAFDFTDGTEWPEGKYLKEMVCLVENAAEVHTLVNDRLKDVTAPTRGGNIFVDDDVFSFKDGVMRVGVIAYSWDKKQIHIFKGDFTRDD